MDKKEFLSEVLEWINKRIGTKLKLEAMANDEVYEYGHRKSIETLQEVRLYIESETAEHKEKRSAKDCGGWIPCKDRLPEETGFYMVTKKIKETGKHFSGGSRFDIEKGWNDPLNFVDIVAWQPLPEPYQPKGE